MLWKNIKLLNSLVSIFHKQYTELSITVPCCCIHKVHLCHSFQWSIVSKTTNGYRTSHMSWCSQKVAIELYPWASAILFPKTHFNIFLFPRTEALVVCICIHDSSINCVQWISSFCIQYVIMLTILYEDYKLLILSLQNFVVGCLHVSWAQIFFWAPYSHRPFFLQHEKWSVPTIPENV